MTSLQFVYAGNSILTKISLNEGMNHFVLVVYRSIFATIVFAPLALFLERNLRAKITFAIFCQIFALGLLGPLSNNFYYVGLKFTSPTFGTAMHNLIPASTFLIVLIFRMEKIRIREIRSRAKIVGTLEGVSGAMLTTFYKGPIVPMPWPSHEQLKNDDDSNKDMVKGCLCLIASIIPWASLIILQAWILKKYPAQLSLISLACLMSLLQSTVVTLAVERHPSAWAVGFDMKLLTAVYAGVIVTGVGYYLQGLCTKTKGPVFTTAFFPLVLCIAVCWEEL
ncbi:hypothetical protein SUGI_0856010 [Cryptomeria japonica]|nr:hypothetical protein SUGI_0856010 [Cryptomeria japonica]